MIFSALRTWKKRKTSPHLHTITVIESEKLPYKIGPWLAQVLGRPFFDGALEEPPHVVGKVVSRPPNFKVPQAQRELEVLGRVVDLPEILEKMDPPSEQLKSTQWRAELLRAILFYLNGREALSQ